MAKNGQFTDNFGNEYNESYLCIDIVNVTKGNKKRVSYTILIFKDAETRISYKNREQNSKFVYSVIVNVKDSDIAQYFPTGNVDKDIYAQAYDHLNNAEEFLSPNPKRPLLNEYKEWEQA